MWPFGIVNKYPYTDFHELNLDWLINLVNKLEKTVNNFVGMTPEMVKNDVNNWLEAHPEATTTVLDGAITETKLSDSLKLKTIKDYITPEMHGAVGDGISDDSTAISNALEEAYTTGLPIVGTRKYKVTSIHIEHNNTVMFLNEVISTNDAFVISSSYNNLEIEKITSTNGCGVVFSNGKYTKFSSNIIRASTDAVKLISNNDSVMFNNISVIEAHGAIGIHLDYSDANNAAEWVNENIFHVWAIHAPIGIHIRGASYSRCNANVFYDPDFELCTTAGVVVDGQTQYNQFLHCRNEEVIPDRVLFQINGGMRSSIIDCKMPAYATNFISTSTLDNRNTPNIITNGLYTDGSIIMWNGQVAFTTNAQTPILYPLTKQKQTSLYITGTTTVLNPRTNPTLCRASALIGNGVRTLDISDDFGYNAGSLPDLIISRDDTLTLTKNGVTLATITNTDPNNYRVIKHVYFMDDTTIQVV